MICELENGTLNISNALHTKKLWQIFKLYYLPYIMTSIGLFSIAYGYLVSIEGHQAPPSSAIINAVKSVYYNNVDNLGNVAFVRKIIAESATLG